jgi:glycosyltransferase involved in cell wall biosynthesis
MAVRFPKLSLSVVFPAYNEIGNIERTLPQAIAELREQVGRFEVIVIDDCSKDATYETAQAIARDYPEVRLYKNEVNLRQGATLARGFTMATMDLVTHNAMDYPFHFSDLPVLLEHFEETPPADVVVASRKTYPGTTAPRRFVSWTNRALIRALFGTTIEDYNFIQIYRRDFLQSTQTISTATSFLTPEKIIRAHAEGLRVVEVVVDYHRREVGTPSSANAKNIKQALRDMARLRWALTTEKLRGRAAS